MSSEAGLQLTLWEKLTDTLGSLSEGMVGFMGMLFGSSNEKLVRAVGYVRGKGSEAHSIVPGSILAQVNAWEEHMQSLSDEDLKGLTAHFRERIEAGETLDELLPEAFAAVREAGWRFKKMRHFDVQIVGGAILHQGKIAEMVTGEGKTLVATLAAFLNGLSAKGVHVITVNDYLARRDCEWMSPIFTGLGLTAGYIQSDMDAPERRRAYDCDITYGTNSEFGFDYLRDNMKPARWGDPNYPPEMHQVQRALNYAVIDEVDNILIDEARTPLIISGPSSGAPKRYADADRIARELTRLEKEAQKKLRAIGHGLNIPGHILSDEKDTEAEEAVGENGVQDRAVTKGITKAAAKARADAELDEEEQAEIDVSRIELPPEEKKTKRLGYYFEVKEKERSCHLTDEGVRKAEELAGVESFYTAGNMEWPHLLDNALKAHHLYQKDKDYVVMRDPESNKMAIIIVDSFTGRLMLGRQWSDGLHQAVEAKHAREGVVIKEETQTLATITLQNYFRLYQKLSGMTGTAMTEAGEFWKIYKLEVVNIPTNKPLHRLNYPDAVFLSEKEKWDAVVKELELIHKYDVVHLKDGSELIGLVKNETATEIVLELKDSREKQTIAVDAIDEVDRHGRPILVGTTSVEKSEKLKRLLDRKGIKCELLNAKPEHAGREADIVAQAGRVGSVTIATNMAGRGTDIILGGNPETLAWARLKDTYATRLDVPDDVWKQTVEEMRARENMEEEGREVVEMGGLHIVGTERHESRRIDNQLRGRAGRQGDPGSGRFYVSLQDDLMRIFGGEWVASWLQRMGMQEGEAIENRMVTRRIESCQKKVEEHNFDIRKNLLEYDEVMDHQRKRVYGYRQEILNDANCKTRVWDMMLKQIDLALERYLDENYGPASFAELVQQQLTIECEAADFGRASFEEAERIARNRAHTMVPTQIHEAMDENLDTEIDPSEWNWQAMADRANKLWGLKVTDKQLKKLGRDNVAEYLIAEGNKVVNEVDLSKGQVYLEPDWGVRELCGWLERKFEVKLSPEQIDVERARDELRQMVVDEVRKLYREKEIEFPVTVAMARFMSDQGGGPAMGQKYNREGLYHWYMARFGGDAGISEEAFHTEPRSKLKVLLLEASRKSLPEATHDDIDAVLHSAFAGARVAEEADAQELSEWTTANLKLDVPTDELIGLSYDEARDLLWNAFDVRYRPELRRMERSLLLNQLDSAWKNHLLSMDHLRQGIGLVSYAQVDPKTEFKRVGMKEFDAMWDTLTGKVTDVFFKLEDEDAFNESVWAIGAVVHEEAPRPTAAAGSIQADQQAGIAGSQTSDKKAEPIRNRADKVGRNDPCPCGSGKKYKNCHMRHAVK